MGIAHLRHALNGNFKLDPHLERAIRWCQSQWWARRILTACSWTIAFTFIGLSIHHSNALFLAGFVLFFGLSRAIHQTWKRQLLLRIQGTTKLRLRLSSTSLLMSDIQQDDLQ